MPKAHTIQAHFTIDGEWLTQHVRSLWAQEDRPEHALKTLMCLDGITEAQALSVLEGRCKLVGDSDIGISIMPDGEAPKGPTLEETLRRLKDERDEARDEKADLIQMDIGATVGFGSPGGLRHVPVRKTQGDIDGKRRLLDGYGWEENLRPGEKPLRIYQEVETPFAVPVEERAVRTEKVLRPIVVRAFSDAEKNSALRTKGLPVDKPRAEGEIVRDTGWLSPYGDFYPCAYAEHKYIAEALDMTEQEMDNLGWVKVCVHDGQQQFFGFLPPCKARPTDVQKQRVIDYCLTKGIELPHWAKDE